MERGGSPDVVRPEYNALVDGLLLLMRDFDRAMADDDLRDLRGFMAATEHIDRLLDAIPAAAARRSFSDAVLVTIGGADAALADLELVRHLQRLHGKLLVRGAAARFVELAREALDNTERMRTTRDAPSYLDAVEREGQLFVELMLLFIAPGADPRFTSFLRSAAGGANLVDKLLDMRGDYARGELALRPGVRLHARLVARLLRRVPRAAVHHPRRLRFAAWSLGVLLETAYPRAA